MEAGARSARLRSLVVSPEAFAWLAWAALAALFLIVVSGATVRLTGSGLGCENWPRCGDTFLPPKDYHAFVEFGNRAAGFAVGLTTLVAAAAAFRVPDLPRWLLWSAVALPFTVLAQGVLGGITVLYELHPLIVMGHFLLSLVALGVALVVLQGARDHSRGATPESALGSAWPALALVPAALALVVSGTLVTAAGPHSGGEDIQRFGDAIEAVHIHIGATAVFGIAFLAVLALVPAALALVVSGTLVTAAGPHSGGEDIQRFGDAIEAVHIHIGATAVFGVAFLAVLALLVAERRRARVELRLAGAVFALLLAQLVIGEVQWREGLPWGLVLLHITVATGIWIVVVALAVRIALRRRARLPA